MLRRSLRMPRGEQPLEVRVSQRWIGGKPSPEHERIPLLLHHQRARAGFGMALEEVASPHVAVRSHVKARQLICRGHVRDVFASVCRIAEAKGINIVIPHGSPSLPARSQVLQQRLDEGWFGDRIHVRYRILEAELELTRIVSKGVHDVALRGPVEAILASLRNSPPRSKQANLARCRLTRIRLRTGRVTCSVLAARSTSS